MTSAAPPVVEDLVRRLLATEDAGRRRALIDRARLSPEDLRDAVLRLVDEADRVLGQDPRRMERICLDARALAARSDDEYAQAMALMRYGDACRYQGRNIEARDCYDGAAVVFTRLGHPVEAARTRIGWVSVSAALGYSTKALIAARAARRVLVTNGETYRAATLEMNIGILHAQQGRYRAALHWFTSALTLFRSCGESGEIMVARCHANRGRVFTYLGRYDAALSELEFARATYGHIGESTGVARLTRSIGELHMELGRYAAGLQALEQAQLAFSALGLDSDTAQVALPIADCYLRLNRPADALAMLNRAQSHANSANDAQYALGLAVRRATAHFLLDQQEAALSVLDAAEQHIAADAVQHRAWLATQRAALLSRDGAPDKVLSAAREAQVLARKAGIRRLMADALITQGGALLTLGDIDGAQRAGEQARRRARDIDAAPLLHRTHELLGRLAESQGRTVSARRHYAAAIRQVEREQAGVIFEFRDSFATGRGLAYERLALLQLRAGNAAAALATVERAKSRALTDAVAGTVELRPRGTAAARRLARELAAAREAYAIAAARLTREDEAQAKQPIQEQMSDHLTEIESRIVGLMRQLQLSGANDQADLLGAPPETTLPSPPPDTALVEFFFSGDDVLRFVVGAGGVHGDVLPGAVPELERLLRFFRVNLDATERAAPQERGQLAEMARRVLARLYDRLLGDVGGLSTFRSLVIVPHGLLHYLPFHALHDGKRYLVERFEIVYAPSATIYGICRSRRTSRRRRSLVLAHSADGKLPFTLQEAAAIGTVLGTSVHTEGDATRTRLERDGRHSRVIHIAAHGRFRADAPLFSAIELADGPLTAADVFNLDLRAGLIALSACETGRAVLGGGDELVGLSRAFLYAGAAALLVSQWRVDDASTAVLMRRFYEALTHGAGPGKALRAAQIAAIAEEDAPNGGRHPFFWAGFQVVGADTPLRRRAEHKEQPA